MPSLREQQFIIEAVIAGEEIFGKIPFFRASFKVILKIAQQHIEFRNRSVKSEIMVLTLHFVFSQKWQLEHG